MVPLQQFLLYVRNLPRWLKQAKNGTGCLLIELGNKKGLNVKPRIRNM